MWDVRHSEVSDQRHAFLRELELFKVREQTAKFVFKDLIASTVSNFIQNYCELLFTTYQYKLC
ncbi:conserved hypothetical protein [Oenococcus oeni]|nr:conserved hypothetical protein [Oenococcus oeni]